MASTVYETDNIMPLTNANYYKIGNVLYTDMNVRNCNRIKTGMEAR